MKNIVALAWPMTEWWVLTVKPSKHIDSVVGRYRGALCHRLLVWYCRYGMLVRLVVVCGTDLDVPTTESCSAFSASSADAMSSYDTKQYDSRWSKRFNAPEPHATCTRDTKQ